MNHKQNTYLNLASMIFQQKYHHFFQAFPTGKYILYFLFHLFIYLSIALCCNTPGPDLSHGLSPEEVFWLFWFCFLSRTSPTA